MLKTLLQTGAIDFEGEHFTAHARITSPINVPVLGSALLPGAFRACGEVADGVISWMAPQRYIEAQALPALREGAIQAGRKTPPLYYHVPVCVTTDREQAFAAAREQVGTYANLPTYAAMFEAAGHESKGGLDEAYYGEYLIYGAKEEVARQLREGLNQSAAEVIAHPVLVGDRDASLRDIFSAIATANQ